jgi:hypothetical protein
MIDDELAMQMNDVCLVVLEATAQLCQLAGLLQALLSIYRQLSLLVVLKAMQIELIPVT